MRGDERVDYPASELDTAVEWAGQQSHVMPH